MASTVNQDHYSHDNCGEYLCECGEFCVVCEEKWPCPTALAAAADWAEKK